MADEGELVREEEKEDGDTESVASAPPRATIRDMTRVPDDDAVVMRVEFEKETLEVRQSGMKYLERAMDASAAQPTYFFKVKFVVLFVCDVLKLDLKEYSFPDDDKEGDDEEEDLEEWSWATFVTNRKETLPKGKQPPKSHFRKVKVVYNHVKDKKDAECKALGMPGSGIQSLKTFKIKWATWRKWCAIYKEMNPDLSNQSLLDKMHADLKFFKSENLLDNEINKQATRYANKLKQKVNKERAQQEIAQEEARLQQAAAAAEKTLKDAETKVNTIKDKKTRAVAALKTRSGRASRDAVVTYQTQEKQALTARKQAKKADRTVKRQMKNFLKRKATVDKAVADNGPPSKKQARRPAPRNDLALVNEVPTPRKVQELDGDGWKPPKRIDGSDDYEQPGDDWKAASIEKVKLLIALREYLVEESMIDKMPPFVQTMTFIGTTLGEMEFSFFERAFLYLVALYFNRYWYAGTVLNILLSLIENDLAKVDQFAAADVAALENALKVEEKMEFGDLIPTMKEVANQLNSLGHFPTDIDEFIACGVDQTLARRLCRDVFGSSQLVIGLNTRKVVVAIDLIDWEGLGDGGFTRRSDVKPKDVKAQIVDGSVSTWIPPGLAGSFQDALESLGDIIGANARSFWGDLYGVIDKKFSQKDKTKVKDMTDAISRYYKAVKCGTRTKYRF